MVMERLLEFLRPEQSVGEVGEKPHRHETGEPMVEDHGVPPLKPVAGDRVANRQHEKAEPKSKQHQVQHLVFTPCQTTI
jgi:hypothetical protein